MQHSVATHTATAQGVFFLPASYEGVAAFAPLHVASSVNAEAEHFWFTVAESVATVLARSLVNGGVHDVCAASSRAVACD